MSKRWERGVQGFKGGSDSARTPVEAPDSLVSTEYARIIDLLSEGEIYGLVDGANSILLDETPSPSFPSFSWDVRNGTQEQSYLAGFPAVESETSIGVTLDSGSPWIRSFFDLNLSAVRINFSVARLLKQDPSNGDTNGYSVAYAIDVAEGSGAFVEVLSSAFTGKTTNGYTRSVRVDLPGQPDGGWRIRVRRITPEATTSNIVDDIVIRSITEIVDAKFRYPNSAIVGTQFDAEAFGGSVPVRAFHIRGRIIRVPSNYDPESRTYSGVWDGTFQLAYSNNPAWVYYDLLLHERFGLGTRISAAQVDKWGLYQIGRYCDESVDDGKGGQEPRFTCNLYLQQRADALKVLQDVAAIFRGITYWGAGQAVVSADMPTDPVYTYTNANVQNGKFSYKGSKRSTRYSVALVSWNDPTDMFRAKVEYVQDEALIARYGVREVTLTAIGCSSQGQAQRAGRWVLLTNQYETEMVSFGVGLEGIRAMPGQVVRIADAARAGKRIGGRIRSATADVVVLDQLNSAAEFDPVLAGSETAFAGSTLDLAGSGNPEGSISVGDELTVILPDGVAETRTVAEIVGPREIRVFPAFSAAPVAQSTWAHDSAQVRTQLVRITGISENGPLDYTISATKYLEGKHANVDFGTIISQRPVTQIPTSSVPAPANIILTTDWKLDQYAAVTTLTIAWDAAVGAVRYDVEWKRDESDWVYAGRVATTEIDVVGVYAGAYQARVRSINSLNVLSPWTQVGPVQLQGKTSTPPAVVGLRTESGLFSVRVLWGVPVGAEDTAYTELRYGATQDPDLATTLGRIAYPTESFLLAGLGPGARLYFQARLIDKTGNIGPWSAWVSGVSETSAEAILDYLVDQITETQLSADLMAEIEAGGGSATAIEQIHEELRAAITLRAQVRASDGQLVTAGVAVGVGKRRERDQRRGDSRLPG